jgi:hypothetical protein
LLQPGLSREDVAILVGIHGDQMGLRKNRPNCSPINFLPKLIHILNQGNKSHRNGGYFWNFQKTALIKQSPIGRNLATLSTSKNGTPTLKVEHFIVGG